VNRSTDNGPADRLLLVATRNHWFLTKTEEIVITLIHGSSFP